VIEQRERERDRMKGCKQMCHVSKQITHHNIEVFVTQSLIISLLLFFYHAKKYFNNYCITSKFLHQ